MKRQFCIVLFLLVYGVGFNEGFSQNSWPLAKQKIKKLCLSNKYQDALDLWEVNRFVARNDEEGQFLKGLALYHLNRLNEAETLFKELLNTRQAPIAQAHLYLGKIYHFRNEFDKAVVQYKKYLRISNLNDANRRLVKEDIERCSNGVRLFYQNARAYVENLGPDVNTSQDEFGAIPSPTQAGRLYFSSIRKGNNGGSKNIFGQYDEEFGQFSSDIYLASNTDGVWRNPKPMHYLINSNQHDVILGFNKTGQTLYYYQGRNLEGGRILVDTFQSKSNRRLKTNLYYGPIEKSVNASLPHFFNDSIVIFSSRKAGGYGGLDLYISIASNGIWTQPQNLGPNVNSAYDETTPFLGKNGNKLYFSSNNPELSLGGFDILYAELNPANRQWSTAINLGLPLNSAGDETHFRMANDGYSAFFTSTRKDGFGMRDLYVAYFNELPKQKPKVENYVYESPTIEEPEVVQNTTVSDPFGSSTPVPTQPAPKSNFEIPRGNAYKINIPKLYFNQVKELNNTLSFTELQKLTDQLKQYSQLKLVIQVYSSKGVSKADKLFNGMFQAQKVADLLQYKGINRRKVILRSFDESASEKTFDTPYACTLELVNKKGTPVSFSNSAENLLFLDSEGLTYKIEVAQSNEVIDHPLIEEMPNTMSEMMSTGKYSFTFGSFNLLSKAKEVIAKLPKKLRSDLSIVPYVYGMSLGPSEIEKYRTTFPDLKNLQ